MEFTKIEDLKQRKLYKVCQVISNEIPELYFVEDSHGYLHKDILTKILALKKMEPDDVIKVVNGKYLIYQGKDIIVSGMGGATLLPGKELILFGNSVDFDMYISNVHIEKFKEINPEWRFKIPPSPRESLAS